MKKYVYAGVGAAFAYTYLMFAVTVTLALTWGWVANVINVLQHGFATFEPLFIAQLVGLVFAPLGVVLGWAV